MGRRNVALELGMAALVLAACQGATGYAVDLAEAIQLSRQFIATDSAAERKALAAKLQAYDGPVSPVLSRLWVREYRPVKPGYYPAESFGDEALRRRHADDLLYFAVPATYRPDRPTGLVIFLHGGGRTTSPRAPSAFLQRPAEDDDGAKSNQIGDLLTASGMIAVGPSAPRDEDSPYRWCLRESEPYLADVIEECRRRFNVDSDRVFLMGHSMGGFGAYHHALRQPDRFAGVLVTSGSWALGNWSVIRGTPLWIVHGVHDARKGGRRHYTDIEYARHTNRLLDELNLDHVYREHEGKHAIHFARPYLAEFLAAAQTMRRDSGYRRVCLVSPLGFRPYYCSTVKHNRWLTLNEAGRGTVHYDELASNGAEDFDEWRLEYQKIRRRGSTIRAELRASNVVEIETRNVVRFTVWLNQRMVDMGRPVQILVNGKRQFQGRVAPRLTTALESYLRRRDPGLIYPAKVELHGDQSPAD